MLHRLVSQSFDVDVDVDVSVFEANIRLLGGLLSAHLLATDPSLGLYPARHDLQDSNRSSGMDRREARRDAGKEGDDGDDEDEEEVEAEYNGELLALAESLGRRLLPAFETPTGNG